MILNRHLQSLNPEFVQFNSVAGEDIGPSSNIIFDIVEDKEGKIWMATTLGINVFDPIAYMPSTMSVGEMKKLKSKTKFTSFSYRYDASNTIPSNVVNGIAINREGILWASTNGGVAEFDPRHKAFQPIYFGNKPNDGPVIFSTVTEMPNGQLWFGTDVKGLQVLDTLSKRFIPIEKIMPSKTIKAVGEKIFSLYLHDDKYLFIGSEKGVFRINTTNFSFETILDGVQYSQQNQGATLETKCIFEDGDNNIWLGTTYGLYRYYPTKHVFRKLANQFCWKCPVVPQYHQ